MTLPPPASVRIQPRVLEIAKLKSTGLTNKEIAHLLGITEQTVKNHLSNLYAVLGVNSFEGAQNAMGWVFPGGLTPEAIADTFRQGTYMKTLKAHEALDEVIAEGLEMVRMARSVKALLRADPRAEPRHD